MTEQNFLEDLMPKRAAFIKWAQDRALDVTEDRDAWGRRKFMHTHIEAMWEGWFNAPVEPQQSVYRYIRPDEICIVGCPHDGKMPRIDMPIVGDGTKDGRRVFLVALPTQQQHAQAALSADQIEELMPENEGNNGAFPCEKCGWIQVSAQWLHDFARNVHQASQQPAVAQQEINTALDRADAEDANRFPPTPPQEAAARDERATRIADGLAVLRMDYAAQDQCSASTESYVQAAVEQLVDAGWQRLAALAAPSPAMPAPGADAEQSDFPSTYGNVAAQETVRSFGDKRQQQGRAAGIEEAAKLLEPHAGIGIVGRLLKVIRALNKQEPTA